MEIERVKRRVQTRRERKRTGPDASLVVTRRPLADDRPLKPQASPDARDRYRYSLSPTGVSEVELAGLTSPYGLVPDLGGVLDRCNPPGSAVATSLARLWQCQDKCQEAYDLLVPVYDWFTEGFNTVDLVEVKQLLNELSADIGPTTA